MPIAVLPWVKVVKIGGQSIIDRGREALIPILQEIVQARDDITAVIGAGDTGPADVLICCGGGTRARSIYALASDLKLPTGILSALGARVPVQNARIVQTALASQGGIFIDSDMFGHLPLYFASNCIPVMGGMPPYSYWEMRDDDSRIPPNRTDAGTFLTAEYLGARRAIFIKDEDGLYTDDPKIDPNAFHIPVISAAGLIERNLDDVVLERSVIDMLPKAVHCRELQIINGLNPGDTLRALRGDDTVGSLITAD